MININLPTFWRPGVCFVLITAWRWGRRIMSAIMAASLISPWLLWWPPAESHYNIHDHSVVGYVSHAHCIVLLYSAGNKITMSYVSHCSTKIRCTVTVAYCWWLLANWTQDTRYIIAIICSVNHLWRSTDLKIFKDHIAIYVAVRIVLCSIFYK